ncbi:multifunctional CCA tRNA nucleotidyl transferase/2'3'-cyclic phosphodiesterase/2'nucleotidase/phosphatase [Massilia sp.]|uniref:multifunctional CCA tRNA nucleotidyl transferase/2'3'-cyclic phosphodiesterase/2'nucleotidase/phosphatase n=1 Tax=Massilia sp. TaxID=1882437 RepID=UPI0028B0D97C|nr:multifunctional CCA tRNA nucleotidyl transferase/2'3'-cyclic phosphodiesterase/2'nucleotidase/phosphatase [Massilia sp.]
MKTYVVGGAVRDALLGLPVQDRDHVVVGATPDQMVAAGFRPVGKDFPVFLHPETQEEYALARTERKTAPGYHGFVFHTAPDVTLEDDLVRRDLTINAMARADDGSIVDPYGGKRDLEARLFRHVSSAFAEDPVRILRVARFAARFADFRVAEDTNALMRSMVEAGEVDALVPERVWQELSRGLMERRPSRMFAVLRDCGALARIMPELDALWGMPQPRRPEVDNGVRIMEVIDHAAELDRTLAVRCAVLMRDLGGADAVAGLCKRLKVPNDCRDLALITAREHSHVEAAAKLDAAALVALFGRCDAFRKPERFAEMLLAAACHAPVPQAWLLAALEVARGVDAGAVAASCAGDKARIPDAVLAARVAAVGSWMAQSPPG